MLMVRAQMVLLGALLNVAAGCSNEAVPAATVVRIEAGVRVVENTGTAAAQSGWDIPGHPIYRVGWSDDGPTFELIRAGFIRPNGGAVVADVNGQRIYVLDALGGVERILGEKGDGPGEFRALNSVVSGGGDTILAQDIYGPVATFVGGELVSTGRVDWGWRVGNAVMDLRGRARDDHLIALPGAYDPRPGDGWSTAPILRISRNLVVIDTVAMVDHFQQTQPRDRNPIRGHGTVALAGDGFVVARSDKAELTWLDSAGGAVQIARWDFQTRNVGEDDWRAFEAAARSRGSGPEMTEDRMNQWLEEAHADFGGTLPTHGIMFVDRVGNVWLSEYAWAGAKPEYFSVVAPDGEWLGRVAIPGGVDPLDATDTQLLGVETDEYGVNAVVLYEIRKPREQHLSTR